jgi:hypothetical protein
VNIIFLGSVTANLRELQSPGRQQMLHNMKLQMHGIIGFVKALKFIVDCPQQQWPSCLMNKWMAFLCIFNTIEIILHITILESVFGFDFFFLL